MTCLSAHCQYGTTVSVGNKTNADFLVEIQRFNCYGYLRDGGDAILCHATRCHQRKFGMPFQGCEFGS